jgi:hypothetical protein
MQLEKRPGEEIDGYLIAYGKHIEILLFWGPTSFYIELAENYSIERPFTLFTILNGQVDYTEDRLILTVKYDMVFNFKYKEIVLDWTDKVRE